MSTSATPTKHILVALNLPRRIPDLIAYAKSIVTAMTGNASFPNPNPALATLEADVDALDTAEASVLTRTKGAAATRNVKLATVRSDLDLERAYVQQVANTNPATAESVIHSSGMAVKKITLRSKPDLAAVAGPSQGRWTSSPRQRGIGQPTSGRIRPTRRRGPLRRRRCRRRRRSPVSRRPPRTTSVSVRS
jgi:hypothetical protein